MNTHKKKRKKKNQKEKETFSMDVTDRWETTGSSERWRNWKIPSLPSYSCLPLSYDINNAVAAALSSSRGVEESNNIQTKLNEGSAMIPSDSVPGQQQATNRKCRVTSSRRHVIIAVAECNNNETNLKQKLRELTVYTTLLCKRISIQISVAEQHFLFF